MALSRRTGGLLAVAYLDLDGFKPINDRHGHAAGDRAIKAVAQCMKSSFRETDILIRYGGDEFVALFPETDGKKAAEGIERFRGSIAKLSLAIDTKTRLKLSVSLGLATFDKSMRQPIELFELADKRMYDEKRSKKAGRAPEPAGSTRPARAARPKKTRRTPARRKK